MKERREEKNKSRKDVKKAIVIGGAGLSKNAICVGERDLMHMVPD